MFGFLDEDDEDLDLDLGNGEQLTQLDPPSFTQVASQQNTSASGVINPITQATDSFIDDDPFALDFDSWTTAGAASATSAAKAKVVHVPVAAVFWPSLAVVGTTLPFAVKKPQAVGQAIRGLFEPALGPVLGPATVAELTSTDMQKQLMYLLDHSPNLPDIQKQDVIRQILEEHVPLGWVAGRFGGNGPVHGVAWRTDHPLISKVPYWVLVNQRWVRFRDIYNVGGVFDALRSH